MRYSLLRTFSMNLGDEIQNLAAAQYLPRVDLFVDRERMHEVADGPASFLIANGWFLHRPDRFPPSGCLRPFYISLHVNGPDLLTPEAVRHFKRCGPIGCRDRHTLSLLRGRGIPSYLSGCLTWTLPPRSAEHRGEVLVVDVPKSLRARIPADLLAGAVEQTHTCYSGLSRDYHPHRMPLSHFDWFALRDELGLRRQLGWTLWGRRRSAVDLSRISAWRLARAQDLLDRYARAKLVITTRIHAYFPCLAFETPSVLLKPHDVYAPQRYSFELTRGNPAAGLQGETGMNWNPVVPDISAAKRFLRLLCERAVEICDNPLKSEAIEDYYQASGWSGDGIS